jgi:protein-S-isoprenylcysteine O-methyltransferase Ste14
MQTYSLAIKSINACWIMFGVVWLLAAASTKRFVYRESAAERLRYMVLLIIGYALVARDGRLPYPLNLRVIPKMDAIASASAILCVAGLAFAFWARAVLGRNWSGTVTLKEGHELIERGPYRLVRHPIYTGLLAMSVATALVLGHLGGLIGVPLVFLSFWIKLGVEEMLMRKQFPEQYAAYERRVKRIVPFVL